MKELISNGADIIDVSRIKKILEGNGDAFLRKVFTENEIEYLNRGGMKPESVAGYFSVKESVMKTLGKGIGEISFREIEIEKDNFGKPHVVLTGKAEKARRELAIGEFLVSISHEKNYALTFVIGTK